MTQAAFSKIEAGLKEALAFARGEEVSGIRIRHPRSDLTPEQRDEALRIGRIEFASAGATRKR